MYEGYVHCACPTCFEIAIGKSGEAMCFHCQEAGCETTDTECSADRELYEDAEDEDGEEVE